MKLRFPRLFRHFDRVRPHSTAFDNPRQHSIAFDRTRPHSIFQPCLRRAFTSIELLFVIVLISLLIGLLVPGVKALHRDAQKRRAQTDLQTLAQALRNYQLAYGHLGPFTNTTASAASTEPPKPFPLDVSALRPGHSENHRDILFITTPSRSSRYTDPWGNSYHILFGRDNADEISGFTLSSPGPDKTPGTSDDISLHSY